MVLDPDILIANGDAICDGEDQVIGIIPGGLTPPGAAATYQWFFNGAIIPGATNEDLTVTQAGTYMLEVAYQGCDTTDEIIVEFVANPIAGTPTPLVECDEVPNDGEAEFTLTDADTDVINGQANTFVTYHETEAQAEAGTNVISSPYVSSTQTIYARLEENTLGCYNVIALDLVVNAAPAIAEPIDDYLLCDNDGDGTEDFDLITWGEDEILNGLTDVTLTYYNTQTDADIGDPATEIPTPTAYPSIGAETIWVRAVNLNLCVTVSSFNLEIPRVTLQEVGLFQVCDDSTPDGFTLFDLDSQTTTINLNNPILEVTYHLTEADAEAGTIPSLASPYTNITNSQIIWVRVFNTLTTCYRYFQMELYVISPIAGTSPPLVSCDEVPNDEFSRFDLSEADDFIINGQTDMSVTYHLTEPEAEAGVGILPIVFTNTIPTNQTIYARLQSTILGFEDCYDTVELDLIVNAAPAIAEPIAHIRYVIMIKTVPKNFDLSLAENQILNGLLTYLTYYNSEPDADLGDPVNCNTNTYCLPKCRS